MESGDRRECEESKNSSQSDEFERENQEAPPLFEPGYLTDDWHFAVLHGGFVVEPLHVF